ncbi:metallopeptidase TldD-related protein [Pseudomonas sp. GD03862]|uniref:metallopeptidase TldD-related protein n=1 Tax=Pseudomonas sp. GLN_3 TaxID=3367181 RepID=UPI0024488327|nr:metallopeptidase TldD-related protein [Pseudomonas sp. GD03862]MDH0704942.1 metallopeptidase TldD-related protein [Pseudomonas sp. GD03862]
MATRERLLVSEGVLQSYLLDAYAARRLGLALTGNAGGARNVRITSRRAQASDGLAELVRAMDRGLLVTDILGGGVNPVTGDYSQGVAGFWVEQGVIRYPVEDITIAGNLHDIFHGIQAIGRDELPGAGMRCGSVLVEHMRIAGL